MFELVKTGEVLFNETQLDGLPGEIDINSKGKEMEDEEEGCDDDEEEENEEVAEEEERQREIFVHLRHASLGDYLKRPDLKPTTFPLTVREAPLHIVLTSLQIICTGAVAAQELWLCLMTNFLDQLCSLDDKDVSEEDTKRIFEYLLEIFLLEPLQKHTHR